MAQTKQQKQLVVLAALVVIAAVMWYAYFGKGSAAGSGLASGMNYTPINAQDYTPIISDLKETQKAEYKSAGRNIFVMGPMPADPAKNAAQAKPVYVSQGPQPPPPPPPATLDMVFFGYGMLPAGGPRQAFLKESNGDDVHIVSEGDLLLNHIRILHIGNEKLDFEDINTGQKGSKALEAPPAA